MWMWVGEGLGVQVDDDNVGDGVDAEAMERGTHAGGCRTEARIDGGVMTGLWAKDGRLRAVKAAGRGVQG